MGWHTGTAANYRDLLAQIVQLAVADGWTQERYTKNEGNLSGFIGQTDEVILQGPGYGPGYETFVGIRSCEIASSNIFSLQFSGMTAYDQTRIFDQQPGLSPPVYLNVWNSPIDFWISISDRRILVIGKCSNTYHSAYAGLILPFSSPVEFPAPIYVASDSGVPASFGNTDWTSRGVSAPGDGGGYFREASGNWRRINVFNQGSNIGGFQSWDATRYTIFPYNVGQGSLGENPGTDASLAPTSKFEPINGLPGSMPMMPCYVRSLFNKGGFQGALEGVFWIPGNTFSAEQEINNGNDTYRVFIQISRSYEQPSPYYAVKEV